MKAGTARACGYLDIAGISLPPNGNIHANIPRRYIRDPDNRTCNGGFCGVFATRWRRFVGAR